ncbi:serine hydrolase domain-containing protein [Nocardia mexicana]|uniref:D-alanyl-D-alanine carboxypeptidase n=1 Tax=Nocardia mexicana TaxID=279262 RepID=A0A370HEJ9_9NOCA|nr:serine hydrolase domain-containing protein [Nocardia mexicana]RDI55455.1 D-alanyl-D-alanine carboxypeptidase [Nocardia mexicana]
MRSLLLLLGCVVLAVAGCSGDTGDPGPAPAARTAAVRGDLDELLRIGAVGAIATLTENGRTTTVAAGTADIRTGQPVSTDRPQHVRVGSVAKTFVAAIVLQLVDAGTIALDEPIDSYLPGLLTGDGVDGRAITVRQLLQHRSGLPELSEDPQIEEYRAAQSGRTFTPDEEIAIALRRPAKFAPGSRYEYTNTNFIVAAMLIERITGHSYTDELQARILTPLGLTGTYLPAAGELDLREPHPIGYSDIDGPHTDVTRIEPSVPWAAGALVSTGADLNRFFTALERGEVVPPAQLREMLDGVPMGSSLFQSGRYYGLGLMYGDLPCGVRYLGHDGGIDGFIAIAGATSDGRAVTISATGSVDEDGVDPLRMLGHALCP